MAGGFTDEERERIREGLIAAGRDLFAQYGIEKTTIGELTDEVGIANGTFYQFFESKVDLYAEVLEREGEELVTQLIAPLEEHDDPETAIVAFLTGLMDEIETNPIVRRLLAEPDELEALRGYYTGAERERHRQEDLSYFLPYVEAWYEAGEIEAPDPETAARAIRAVSMLTLHREDIGPGVYEETRDLVIRAVARGLTTG